MTKIEDVPMDDNEYGYKLVDRIWGVGGDITNVYARPALKRDPPPITIGRCRNCRYLTEAPDLYGFGRCVVVVESMGAYGHADYPEEHDCVVLDDETVVVGMDFGCVHWRKKEDGQETAG